MVDEERDVVVWCVRMKGLISGQVLGLDCRASQKVYQSK